MGHNTTRQRWSICCPSASAAATPVGSVTNDDDRCQRAEQYWPIRRASNKHALFDMRFYDKYVTS